MGEHQWIALVSGGGDFINEGGRRPTKASGAVDRTLEIAGRERTVEPRDCSGSNTGCSGKIGYGADHVPRCNGFQNGSIGW